MDAKRLTKKYLREYGTPVVAYDGEFNPYYEPITIAEILLPEESIVTKYIPRNIVSDILGRLCEYEDTELTPQEIRQQQAEIERLNRAYEVLERAMKAVFLNSKDAATALRAGGSIAEAQRIKEGKDGHRTGGGPACENVDSLYCVKDGKDGEQP